MTPNPSSGAKGRIPLGTILKMHAAYQTPLSMRDVGRQFGVGKSAVARAFRAWGLPVRPKGGFVGQAKPRKIELKSSIVHFTPPPPGLLAVVFCQQCDQRVSLSKAAQCQSPWCKAKALSA